MWNVYETLLTYKHVDGPAGYQLVPGLGQVRPFQVNQSTGALARLAAVSDGLTGGSGAAGIATLNFT